MRLATWNVNSVRARLARVLAYLEERQVDVLALQETKVADERFPSDAFNTAGYQVATWGDGGFNGVAIISRVGLDQVQRSFAGQPSFAEQLEPRAIGATCGSVRLWSLYVPHGRSVDNPHYTYKLAFLQALQQTAGHWLATSPDSRLALLGDWNIAPTDLDVWDPEVFAGQTHVSPAERAAFAAFAQSGFCEVVRQHLPQPNTYTYWDYRDQRFARNQGMLIDFAYCSPALTTAVREVTIVRQERHGKGASDHVPVELLIDD
ncbi:MAG: exodeoxyribonuclease III [Bifidobacteriaceae bacterium]|jgi:exodeoxyribonuclease-3|nr:exodeoxyribonuclease III [Bifidobacteriaceae bacterium]